MNSLIQIFIFIFGACIGSFLNVCIHRWPREESIVKPRSHCPQCKTQIKWSDNIPILSFLLLRGKCRSCSARISPRYFAMELLTGLMWVGLWHSYGFSEFFFAGIVYLSILLSVTITDIETGYIPDMFTIPGMIAGLIFSAAFPSLQEASIWHEGLIKSAAGLLGGGGVLFFIALIGNLIFRKESMGGGDIKLMALMGAFIGLKKVLLVFFFSPILALPVALFVKLAKRGETIPYGPYLAVGGAFFYLYGEQVLKYIATIYGF